MVIMVTTIITISKSPKVINKIKIMKKVVNNLKINTEIIRALIHKDKIKNAVFINCKFDEINTFEIHLSFIDCTFIDCEFGDCFFYKNNFGHCSFTRCDFKKSHFNDCSLAYINFSHCLYHERVIFYNCDFHTINVKNLIPGNNFHNYINCDDGKRYAIVQD